MSPKKPPQPEKIKIPSSSTPSNRFEPVTSQSIKSDKKKLVFGKDKLVSSEKSSPTTAHTPSTSRRIQEILQNQNKGKVPNKVGNKSPLTKITESPGEHKIPKYELQSS